MPFTFDGEWVSKPSPATPNKPVKVRMIKRGKAILTVILNLPMSSDELHALASQLKKTLGCGGSVKDNDIEIQGDKVSQVQSFLLKIGIKSQ